jgi:dTDP-L-rhamnose 4-epimerase
MGAVILSGIHTRDFIFVNDVAKVCQLALSCHHENLVLNVGSGVATKVIDLAQNLKGLWKSDSTIKVTGDFRVGDIRHNWTDLKAFYKIFSDWKPTALSIGLEKLAEWAKTQQVHEDKSKIAEQELKQRNL